MNGRERIKAALAFEPPDRLPSHESFWDGVIESWYEQGMPRGSDPTEFFHHDISMMFVDGSPRYEQKIMERRDGFITYQDRFGYSARKADGLGGTIDFLRHVTVDREAWEQVKTRMRLDDHPQTPARIDSKSYFAHFDPYPTWDEAKRRYDAIVANQRYLLFMAYGPWEATWRHRDMEMLLMDIALEPDWVREMAETYEQLLLDILQRCVTLGIKPDGLFLAEDMGWKGSMLYSPDSWRAVLKPSLRRIGDYLRGEGIDYWLHSDGAIMPVIDDLIECGVQVLNPLETAAGMDVVRLRAQYDNRLAFFGNISAANLLGDRNKLEAEVRRKIPQARRGGYILHSDHSVPLKVTLQQYQFMLDLARHVFDEGP